MREIIFRGKRADNGEWVYGSLITERNMFDGNLMTMHIQDIEEPYDDNLIDDETVGQYTGLTDKNGLTKIFEYDIIDANGRKVGNYYENSNLLKDGTCFLVAKMGTKEWSRSEQEAIKRGCKYAE
ncbi:MAG: hypothetical protein II453_19750 [Alphaproteobacteria bacterium]|nr:hypothetical protein [Alphaproteobacteria bacterium]